VEAFLRASRAGVVVGGPEVEPYRQTIETLVSGCLQERDGEADLTPIVVGEALVRLLSGARGGVVLVLEDLQWADPETLAVVEYLADGLARTPVLCFATVRDCGPSPGRDLVQTIRSRRGARVLALKDLSSSQVRQMAAACLEVDEVPDAVADLVAGCGGLPFAIEETLAAAVSSGRLVRSEQGWQVHGGTAAVVPESIAGSIARRLTELGPVAGTVLGSAAAIGREFDWTLLPDTTGESEPAVLDALKSAREVHLVEAAVPDGAMFRFRHSLTRDAVRSSQLRSDTVIRSARAADAVERAHPGLPVSWCELAAELRQSATEYSRAAALMLEAGYRALGQGALGTAEDALRRAGWLARKAKPVEPELTAEIDDGLIRILTLAGDYYRLEPIAVAGGRCYGHRRDY